MKIGELAEQTGLAPSTIRFYEAKGLLGRISRQPNGYREYAPDAPLVLKIISSAQLAGFSLDEVQRVLPTDLTGWRHDELIGALEAKIANIEAAERQLARNKKDLRRLLREIQAKPADIDCAENARRLITKMAKAGRKAR
ncbi:MerR family transcriptional regulator [Solimonas terrae]|uniref:MerR family DNA-binding transcriptional regulator n=1 Tax=Solimonas terrae TaxID=1396819 RepID=A0A6M2BUM3_9GAMM|nr:MerR family DNA-binding transcriptional regulator [Solimonas terrae]NGY05679.1 MerR family DNA-binding transcriptional regulator [Solimonas terrae]